LTDVSRILTRLMKESVGSCGTCAVCCLLLRERAEAKRRGELELMRNEQRDGGETKRDKGGHEISVGEPRLPRGDGLVDTAAYACCRASEKRNSTTWNYSVS